MRILMLLLFMVNLYAKQSYLSEDYVICSFPKSKLLSFVQSGTYIAESLDIEGFIHCCRPSQLEYVMKKFFAEDEQVLLISHKDKMGTKLVYENDFPHLYRELRAEDLIDIIFLKRKNGSFSLPEVFRESY